MHSAIQPGLIDWYAVRVKPPHNSGRRTVVPDTGCETCRNGKRRITGSGRREFVIETLLRNRGFHVFLPTKTVYRRKSRYTRDKHLVAYPLLVGWVFVGWPKGEYRWHDLFASHLVAAVAGIDGRPCPLPQDVMDGLFKRWGGPKTRAPGRERFMRTHFEFRIGDRARIVEGPLNGMEVRVVDLSGPGARVVLELLGGERVIEIDAMALEVA